MPNAALSTDLLIRDGSDSDGAALGQLIAGVFAEYEGCVFAADEFPELAGVASHFRQRGGRLWVAEDGGALVGSIAAAPSHEPGVFELFKLYLARHLRGRGIGRRLLAEARGFAREQGGTTLVLWTDTRFVDGHRFYENNGFVREPGIRALHDRSATLEYRYRAELAG